MVRASKKQQELQEMPGQKRAPSRGSLGFVENYLLFQLTVVQHFYSEEFRAYLKSQGISPTKWRVLANVYDKPGISINDLSAVTLYDQPRVTKTVDALCREGLLNKVQAKEDRRRVILHTTPAGDTLLAPLVEEAKKHEASILARLDEKDREQFKNILAVLLEPYFNSLAG